jgi:dephospho-CoA kinase
MSRGIIHIGVAGYMGSGKSTFCTFFADAGYSVIDADTEAKAAMAADAGVRSALAAAFGPACTPHDTIDSHALGAAAFVSAGNLRRLNAIVKPVLTKHFNQQFEQLTNTNTVFDAALLPLLALRQRFDHLFWIDAAFDIRLRRLQSRQGKQAASLESRMRIQEEILQRPARGWTTIVNNGDRAALALIAREWIEPAKSNSNRRAQP